MWLLVLQCREANILLNARNVSCFVRLKTRDVVHFNQSNHEYTGVFAQ